MTLIRQKETVYLRVRVYGKSLRKGSLEGLEERKG